MMSQWSSTIFSSKYPLHCSWSRSWLLKWNFKTKVDDEDTPDKPKKPGEDDLLLRLKGLPELRHDKNTLKAIVENDIDFPCSHYAV